MYVFQYQLRWKLKGDSEWHTESYSGYDAKAIFDERIQVLSSSGATVEAIC